MDTPTSQPYTPSPAPMTTPVTPSSPPVVQNQKSSKGGLAALVIVLLLLAGYVAWAWTSDYWPFAPMSSVSPSPSATVDPTAGWKTYTNVQYGFEFRYPGTSVYETPETTKNLDISSSVRIQNYDPNTDALRLRQNEYYLELGIWQKKGAVVCDYATTNRISLGSNIFGYQSKNPEEGNEAGGPSLNLCIDNPIMLLLSVTQGDTNMALARQILSTFRFTDTTAGWKTFTDAGHGFEMQYPPVLTVQIRQVEPPAIYFLAANELEIADGSILLNVQVLHQTAQSLHAEIREQCQGYAAAFGVPDPVFADRVVVIAGKNGWEVDCRSSSAPDSTVTIVPGKGSDAIKIERVYHSDFHKQIVGTFRFTE